MTLLSVLFASSNMAILSLARFGWRVDISEALESSARKLYSSVSKLETVAAFLSCVWLEWREGPVRVNLFMILGEVDLVLGLLIQ